jgi:hypothetical protein
MSKYTPLGQFLVVQGRDYVPLNFKDIEDVIGFRLPPSAYQHRAWWSNNPTNNVMTAVWTAAGYETTNVDMEKHTVVFQRTSTQPPTPTYSQTAPKPTGLSDVARPFTSPHVSGHPLRGALKGTIRVAVDVDLTAPADPDWGANT